MKLSNRSLTAKIAAACIWMLSITGVASTLAQAQTDSLDSQFPTLEGPDNQVQAAPTMFDALGNLFEGSNSKTFSQQGYVPASPLIDPSQQDHFELPDEFAPENIDPRFKLAEPDEPLIVERARPLPPAESLFQPPQSNPLSCRRPERMYSRAEIERALYRLVVLEQLLREQLRRETTMRYPNRWDTGCVNDSRLNEYRPYGGTFDNRWSGWLQP